MERKLRKGSENGSPVLPQKIKFDTPEDSDLCVFECEGVCDPYQLQSVRVLQFMSKIFLMEITYLKNMFHSKLPQFLASVF